MYLSDVDNYLESFSDIWFTNCDSRYRCLKGARATGKTYNFIGIEPVFKLLSDPRRNVLMIRQNDKDNANSNFTMLKSIIYKLGVQHLFKFTTSPHKITRKDTGQVILFCGMNDVENITSTSTETGYVTDIYFEEASQLKSYDEFIVVDGSFRIPNTEPDLKVQITFCFNAWDVGHWLYDVFFKDRLEDNIDELEFNNYQFYEDPDFNIGADGDGLALHISSYKCNPYLSEAKLRGMLSLKDKAYDRYLVEGLGCWGNTSEATYVHFNDKLIIPHYQATLYNYATYSIGIDIGMGSEGKMVKNTKDQPDRVRSAMTMQLTGLTADYNKLVCLNEYFYTKQNEIIPKTSVEIAVEMIETIIKWKELYARVPVLMKGTIVVYVESADPGGFIDMLRDAANRLGLSNIRFVTATKNKIQSRVDFTNLLMAYGNYEIVDTCKNLIREIKNAKKAEDGRCRADIDDHAINANEYSWIPLLPKIRQYRDYKEH